MELIKKKLILKVLWPLKLCYFGQLSCTTRYGIRVIISFHNFRWILSKLYIHVGGALQMCIRLFDTDVIDFCRITVFCNL